MDAISFLPDDVLEHILSFLPTKYAISTSVLSKRWRNVFVSVFVSVSNLEFDYFDIGCPRKFTDSVTKLLNLQGNAHMNKLTLKNIFDAFDPTYPESWICNVLKRGVVDLDLDIDIDLDHELFIAQFFNLMFNCKTLVKLRLKSWVKIKLPQHFSLPMLRTLCLDCITFVGYRDVLETILSRCPVLEDLIIQGPHCIDWDFYVSSPSLKTLRIELYHSRSIFSLDVPNLVCFEYSCALGSKFLNLTLDSLIEARIDIREGEALINRFRLGIAYCIPTDVVNLINAITSIKVLHLSSDLLELLYFSYQEFPVFNNLVRLSIKSEEKLGWQVLPQLIKNSPNLKALLFEGLNHYIAENCGDVCVCRDSKENIPSCLSSCRVKVLEISGYKGTTRELNQIKHFLEKLSYLDLVKICGSCYLKNPIDVQQLLTLPRASSNCKIQVIS